MRRAELRKRWLAERAAAAMPVEETPTADMEAIMAALASDEQSAGNRHGGEGGGGGGAADLPSDPAPTWPPGPPPVPVAWKGGLSDLLHELVGDVANCRHKRSWIGDGKERWTREKPEPVTAELLRRYHRPGAEPTVHVFLEAPDGRCERLVLDIDDKDGADWQGVVWLARRLAAEVHKDGGTVLAFRSRGGKGVHLWIRFDGLVTGAEARAYGRSIVERVGCKVGDGGVTKGEVEVHPKGKGLTVALPFSGASKRIELGEGLAGAAS